MYLTDNTVKLKICTAALVLFFFSITPESLFDYENQLNSSELLWISVDFSPYGSDVRCQVFHIKIPNSEVGNEEFDSNFACRSSKFNFAFFFFWGGGGVS